MKPPRINRLQIRNFKAIRNSGGLKLTPLTVLVGNNGSGKSSVIEALETLQTFVGEDLAAAMQMWKGLEHIRNMSGRPRKAGKRDLKPSKRPIQLNLQGNTGSEKFWAETAWNERFQTNEIFIEEEKVTISSSKWTRGKDGRVRVAGGAGTDPWPTPVGATKSLLAEFLGSFIGKWQFLTLWPQSIGDPKPRTRTGGWIRLSKDGGNIAEYFLDIRNRDIGAFNGIVEALKYILPFAEDIQPAITSELERTDYLQLAEADFTIPGWLLSTGTLRILALLATLRHPDPPPLLVVEEIENGLDPRTIHLLVEEIQYAVEAGRTQLILATHSPYLLDLLPLSSIVLVDRAEGQPKFTRPGDEKEVRQWARHFAPGRLYAMGRLNRKAGE